LNSGGKKRRFREERTRRNGEKIGGRRGWETDRGGLRRGEQKGQSVE